MLSVAIRDAQDGSLHIHASTVSYKNNALVIAGPSGSGKSSTALRMMALGAALISDDVTVLTNTLGDVTAHRPDTLPPLLEVRGMGLLNAPVSTGARIGAILDLGTLETDRLPPERHISMLGQDVVLFHKPDTVYVAEAMIHYLSYGRFT